MLARINYKSAFKKNMVNNEKAIEYLSNAYYAELHKILILVGSAGFLGGVLNCTVHKYFTRTANKQATNFVKLIIQYIVNGLLFGLGAVTIVYSFFISNPIESIKMVKTINQFSIPVAILFPPMLTAINETINSTIFQKNKK